MFACSRVFVCETQPVTAEGIRSVLASSWPDVKVVFSAALPDDLVDVSSTVFLIDKALNAGAITEWCSAVRPSAPAVAVWGTLFSDADALRLLQSGVRGLVSKTAASHMLIDCLRSVLRGDTWVEPHLLPSASSAQRSGHNGLTTRERNVLDLVQAGFKNSEIAARLGIAPGTVKIHLKHVFEKTGIHGRYGLMLSARTPDQKLRAAANGSS